MTTPRRASSRYSAAGPDRLVVADRESVGQVSPAGVVAPLGVSLLAAGVMRGALAVLRGWRRLPHRG